MEFEGTTIKVSHPAMVAYFKMHGSGVKDEYDLEMLAQTGVITEGDITQLEEITVEETSNRKKYIDDQLAQISTDLQAVEIPTDIQQGIEQIREVLKQQPFTGMMDSEQYEFLTVLAQQIQKLGSNQETIQDIFYKAYDIDSHLQRPFQTLKHFKSMCGIEKE
ncbi:MAG: hypothetical protein JW922_10235 [Paludibacteraceae bacterium]|nr:hypothetical protein [Paludibacteraceae bacterium]